QGKDGFTRDHGTLQPNQILLKNTQSQLKRFGELLLFQTQHPLHLGLPLQQFRISAAHFRDQRRHQLMEKDRSEERRVGKEWSSRGWPEHGTVGGRDRWSDGN